MFNSHHFTVSSRPTLRAMALCAVLSSAASGWAQSPSPVSTATSTPTSAMSSTAAASVPKASGGASIAEITDLARKVRIAELEKQLREAQKAPVEALPTPSVPLLVPPMPPGQQGGNMSPTGMTSPMGMDFPPLMVMAPEIPAAPVVRGIVMVDGRAPRAQLASGGEVGVGERVNQWTVTAIDDRSVQWERCDRVKTKRKGRAQGATQKECQTETSTPRG